MRVLIIEDEYYAVLRLKELLKSIDPDIEVVDDIDSIATAKEWLSNNAHPDLCFCDIQLGDGLSFEIFKGLDYSFPLVFTTAFDEYALKAFSVNSIDYLLKPIESSSLEKALKKFRGLGSTNFMNGDAMSGLMESLIQKNKSYKKRFLVKKGNSFAYINIQDIILFYSEDGITFLLTREEQRFMVDSTIHQIMETLNANDFFRISRKHIICVHAIAQVKPYKNQRCIVELKDSLVEDLIVSRDRVQDFKKWLDS